MLLLVALLAATPAPRDAWASLVASRADRAAVVKALGDPKEEFVGGYDPSEPLPIQLDSEPPSNAPDAPEHAAPQTVVKVLDYGDRDGSGFHFQVVLQDGKALYAIAPPLDGETTSASVTKKYGTTTAEPSPTLKADLMRSWEVLRYPKKKRAFVRVQGSEAIVGRVVTR